MRLRNLLLITMADYEVLYDISAVPCIMIYHHDLSSTLQVYQLLYDLSAVPCIIFVGTE